MRGASTWRMSDVSAVKRYCPCGYAVDVTGHWTGSTYELTLHDAHRARREEAITACPRCGNPLVLRDLEHLPNIPARRTSDDDVAS